MADSDAATKPQLHASSDPRAVGLQSGDVIGGKYRIERVLGQGGMGVVIAVTHLELGEPFALKFLLDDAAQNQEAVTRFMREAQAAVRIKSEHIARVSDVGRLESGAPYLVMEHLTGEDLGDVIARGPVPTTDAVQYVLQACVGIAEAHALGITHRDLKPSNLFLTKRIDGTPLVKVLDFGISKIASGNDGAEGDAALTATTAVFGSPAYMSPEQIRSAKSADARSDIWALGVILHELLTGRLPFVGKTIVALLAAISADDASSACALRPDLDPRIDLILRRCLAKQAAQRYQSIAELAVALAPFAGPEGALSLQQIARFAPRTPSLPPPTPSLPPPSPVSSAAAFATTERDVGALKPKGRGIYVAATFVLASLVLSTLGIVVVRTRETNVSPPVQTEVQIPVLAPRPSDAAFTSVTTAAPAPTPPEAPSMTPKHVARPAIKPTVPSAAPAPPAKSYGDPFEGSH